MRSDRLLNSEKEENPFFIVREDYTFFASFADNRALYSDFRNNPSDTLMRAER